MHNCLTIAVKHLSPLHVASCCIPGSISGAMICKVWRMPFGVKLAQEEALRALLQGSLQDVQRNLLGLHRSQCHLAVTRIAQRSCTTTTLILPCRAHQLHTKDNLEYRVLLKHMLNRKVGTDGTVLQFLCL